MRKVLLYIIWILIVIIFPVVIFVYDNNSYSSNVPYISSVLGVEIMDINIDVNKDNSIDVVETITFNFVEGTPFEGIRVNFPLRDNINGKKRNIKLSNLSSEDVSIDNKRMFNYNEAHLGKNNEEMVSGLYTYTLKYHYDLGSTDDLFSYKVFSNYYNIDVINMSLTINFKDNIDKNKVRFVSKDSDVTDRITYGVENNVLRASINDFILDQDLTVNVDTDNYFENTKSTDGIIAIIMLITVFLSTIALLIVNILKHKKEKDVKILYSVDVKCILGLIALAILEAFVYLFIHDLSASLEFIYYIVYGIIALFGMLLISRLKMN